MEQVEIETCTKLLGSTMETILCCTACSAEILLQYDSVLCAERSMGLRNGHPLTEHGLVP